MGTGKHSEKTKKLISEKAKERWLNKTYRIKAIENLNKMHAKVRGNKLTGGHKKKISEALKGRKFTEAHRKRISEKAKGRKRSRETSDKQAISLKQRYVDDPSLREQIRKRNLGRKHTAEAKRKIGDAHRGKTVSAETREKLRLAFTGKRASEEQKWKLAIAMKRKWLDTAYRGKVIKGIKNRWANPEYRKCYKETVVPKIAAKHKGKVVSPETGEKIRVAHLGKKVSEGTKRKMSESQKSLWTEEKRRQWGARFSGANSGNWRGGKSFEPYGVGWTKALKESIRQRDNHKCVLCGKKQGNKKLPVHHIDYDKENLNPDNLITLCTNCHGKTNSKRGYWEALLKALMLSKVLQA